MFIKSKTLLTTTLSLQDVVNFLPAGTHRVDLIEGLPLLVRQLQGLGRLDGALQLAGPHLEVLQVLLLHELAQGVGELGGWGEGHALGHRLHPSGRGGPSPSGRARLSSLLGKRALRAALHTYPPFRRAHL